MKSDFQSRTKQFRIAAIRLAKTWYDEKGAWITSSFPPEVRERYWLCLALYAEGCSDLADAIILAGDPRTSHLGRVSPVPYDIFHTNIAAVLLANHDARMSGDVRRKLETLVEKGFDFHPGNRRPDFQFHGANDNMPAKASMGLILGGERLQNREAVAHGLWNLRQLRNLLHRRGTISEWNSPTYSPATLTAIAHIAHLARNAEARELAKGIEERIWLDIAARFHPEIGVLSGPYSRAYALDSIAHASGISSLLWFVLGDVARPSPMQLFEPDSGLVLHHLGDLPFNVAEKCYYASGNYHFSDAAKGLFLRKSYPFRAVASAEAAGRGIDLPARVIRIETFMQPDFTLGTASTPWYQEQSGHYFVTYKKTHEVASFKEVGTVFHKFALNEDIPGTVESARSPDGKPYSNSGETFVGNHANSISLQSGPTALVLTSPRPALGGFEEGIPAKPISRMHELVVFPSHFGGAEEIRVGSEPRGRWAGDVPRGEWVGCRRGRLLIAIRPMTFLAEPEKVKISLEKWGPYEVLRSAFYEGPARTFTSKELAKIFGGFIAEHASVDEFPSLSAFMDSLSVSRFTDYFFLSRRSRYVRPSSPGREPLELETSWTPASASTQYALINGLPVSQDRRVAVDGLQDSAFPFLQGPWISNPIYFPWQKMEADWGTGSESGVIGDKGEVP